MWQDIALNYTAWHIIMAYTTIYLCGVQCSTQVNSWLLKFYIAAFLHRFFLLYTVVSHFARTTFYVSACVFFTPCLYDIHDVKKKFFGGDVLIGFIAFYSPQWFPHKIYSVHPGGKNGTNCGQKASCKWLLASCKYRGLPRSSKTIL